MTNRFIFRLIVFALVILFGVSACQMSAPPHMPSPLDSSAGLETQSSTAFPVRRPPASGQARPATCGFKLLRTEVHSSNTLVTRYVREMPTGDRWFIWLEFRVPSTGQLAYRIGRRMSIDAVAAYDDFDCYGAVANLPSECPCNIPPADGPLDLLLKAPQKVAVVAQGPAQLTPGGPSGMGGSQGGLPSSGFGWANVWSGAAKTPSGFTSGTARTNLNNSTTSPRMQQSQTNSKQTLTLNRTINFQDRKLQKKFYHAKDFGVTGNYNTQNRELYRNKLHQHVTDPNTQIIKGLYRGQQVTHYFNQQSNLNVIKDINGNFVSGWKLGPNQVSSLQQRGLVQ